MRRSWSVLLLATLAAFALASGPLVEPAAAKPKEPEDERGNQPPEPAAWKEPVVRGEIIATRWSEGKDPKQQTATIVIWSKESDLGVNVYGDDPRVRDAILNGTACVGRYAIVGGDRSDEYSLIGRSIEVQNLDLPCRATLQPLPGTQAQPAQQRPKPAEPPAAAPPPSDLPLILPPLQETTDGPPQSAGQSTEDAAPDEAPAGP